MTANRHRGEVEIELAPVEGHRKTFVMRPTWQALSEIEERTGKGLQALAQTFLRNDFAFRDVTAVITAGLKAAGEPASQDTVGELIFKTGLLNAATPAGEFLWNALGTGRDVAEPETPGDEEQEDDGASQD